MATVDPTTEMRPSLARRLFDNDLAHSFIRQPVIVVSAIVALVCILASALAPWIAPHNTFDPSTLDLMDSFLPPAWVDGGDPRFFFGTDDQGRDILSTILYGSRISLVVGFSAIVFAVLLGVTLGIVSGYVGGWLDTLIMRAADIQLTIPGILIALMVNGIARTALPREMQADLAIYVLIFAIGIADWPQFARVVRGATLVEKRKEYVAAAQVIGVHPITIMARHILPNVLGPVLVLSTIGLAQAIITEASLSFLGVGVPPTTPSLGTLIRVGNNFLFSGEWWITFIPALALVVLVLSVNLLGDWLRDALNPKLR